MGDLVFIGDAHLDRDDPHLDAFLRLLDSLAVTAARIVFLGDLFNLWIGQPELEQPHQAAVVAKLAEIRSRGVVTRYLEGNRDYRIGASYAGRAFDDVSSGGIDERFGGRGIWAIHGDLANPADNEPRAVRLRSGEVGYVEPIRTKGLCLQCHGNAIDSTVQVRLNELYPDDQATGFEEGDLRGMFWVKLPAT